MKKKRLLITDRTDGLYGAAIRRLTAACGACLHRQTANGF